MTHDYTRQGTVTLFAALSVLQGTLISRTETQHTHVEWLRFLKQIDREAPKLLDLHLIAARCRHGGPCCARSSGCGSWADA